MFYFKAVRCINFEVLVCIWIWNPIQTFECLNRGHVLPTSFVCNLQTLFNTVSRRKIYEYKKQLLFYKRILWLEKRKNPQCLLNLKNTKYNIQFRNADNLNLFQLCTNYNQYFEFFEFNNLNNTYMHLSKHSKTSQ